MKILLVAGLAFLIGCDVGARLSLKAFRMGCSEVDVSVTAQRAVTDVAAAYENQLQKNGVIERVRGKFESCLRENACLKTRGVNKCRSY